jgi:hypothetical protein
MDPMSDLIRNSFITIILSRKPLLLVSDTPKLQVLEIHESESTSIQNRDYSLAKAPKLALGPSSLLFNGYFGFYSVGKAAEAES